MTLIDGKTCFLLPPHGSESRVLFAPLLILKCLEYFEAQNETIEIWRSFKCWCGYGLHTHYDDCLVAFCKKKKQIQFKP